MKDVVRQADLRGLARYIVTKKGKVIDRRQKQSDKLVASVISEYNNQVKSEAYSEQVKSGMVNF